MPINTSVEQFKHAATDAALVVSHGLHDAATETKREITDLWQVEDEREQLIRTGAICLAVLVGVSLIVTLTGWLPVWLRVLVIVGTIGGLSKWFLSKIADGSD